MSIIGIDYYSALKSSRVQLYLEGTPVSDVRIEGDMVTLCRKGHGECYYNLEDFTDPDYQPFDDRFLLTDVQGFPQVLTAEFKIAPTLLKIDEEKLEQWTSKNITKDAPVNTKGMKL